MMKTLLMGSASMRKKLQRQRSTKTQQNNYVASENLPSKYNKNNNNYYYIILIVTIISGFFVILLFTNSWDLKRVFGSSNQLYNIELVNDFPHDPSAFTQGLLYAGNDTLFESTGLFGQSSVRKVDLHTGKVLAIKRLSNSDFGEGLTLLGERLIQVTWLQKTGFIYNRNNLSHIGKFTHQMEDGWGLATDGKTLFGTDGTSMLYQMDPETFRVISKKTVKYNGREVSMLNELEYINDEVWSNIFGSDCIARISPQNGNVHGWILLDKLRKGLVATGQSTVDILNGIAWDRDSNRIFVTGKLWPKLYEIKLHPAKKTPSPGDIEKICIPRPINFQRP